MRKFGSNALQLDEKWAKATQMSSEMQKIAHFNNQKYLCRGATHWFNASLS